MKVKKEDKKYLLLAVTFLIVVVALGWVVSGDTNIVLLSGLIASTMLILLTILEIYRRQDSYVQSYINDRMDVEYRQIESLFALYSIVTPGQLLPDMRSWAASPDMLQKVAELVLERKPDIILEASCGVSTLITAYCLRKNGKGRVISLEHDAKYAEITKARVEQHGLSDIVTVVHAPLVEVDISSSESWLWYDISKLEVPEPIDLMVVDGPPKSVQTLARYPALPMMDKLLAKDALIFLDDAIREDEKEIVRRWQREFEDIKVEYFPLEKGAFLISKVKYE